MSKMTSAFWGLRLEPGKRYSTTVDKAFHVSMAALDASTIKKDNDVHSVMLEEGESAVPFILCNLQKPNILQQRLSLNFESGDRITFFCKGTGTIHLTGYVIPEDDGFGMMGEEGEEEEDEEEEGEEEEEEEEIEEKQLLKKKGKVNGLPAKRKGQDGSALPAKKKKPAQEDSEEDSDDDDSDDIDELAGSDEELAMLSGEDDEDDDDSGDEEEKTSPAQPSPPQSQGKKEKQKKGKGEGGTPTDNKQQQKKKQTPVSNEGQQGKGAEGKQGAQPGGKKTIEGGVTIQDIKVGSGPICKPGRLASVYYIGRLKSTNKVFDQTSQGPGMKFRVGRGEVIKGWDVGLTGMKVGGKRIITCPPNMAYGQKGMPPTIPGNSTLVFEVELKNVN